MPLRFDAHHWRGRAAQMRALALEANAELPGPSRDPGVLSSRPMTTHARRRRSPYGRRFDRRLLVGVPICSCAFGSHPGRAVQDQTSLRCATPKFGNIAKCCRRFRQRPALPASRTGVWRPMRRSELHGNAGLFCSRSRLKRVGRTGWLSMQDSNRQM